MPFDPDAYLAGRPQQAEQPQPTPPPFDPDAYLAQPAPAAQPFDPDKYLEQPEPTQPPPGWLQERANELKRGGIRAGEMVDLAELQLSTALKQKARKNLADPAKAVHPLDRLVARLVPGMSEALQATPEAKERATRKRLAEALDMRSHGAAQLAINQQAAAAIPRSRAMQDFDRAQDTGDAFAALLRHPVAGITDLTTNSLPSAAGGMALGALTGSEAGPAGTAAGAFAGSLAPEYFGKLQEVAQDMGVDLTKPEQIKQFFADPEKVATASKLALRKGVPIAALDAITAGLAGRWIGPAVGKGVRPVAIAAAKETAAQVTGDALGEALGELAAGEKLSGKDILAEVAAGGPQTIQEAGTNIAHERAVQRWAKALQPSATAAQPETTLPAAAPVAPPQGDGAPTAPAAGDPLPGETAPAPGLAAAGATADAEIAQILATEKAQAEAQRAEVEAATRRQTLAARPLQELVGTALAPRVTALEGKSDLEKHDFWRGLQGLAQTLATLQTMTPDGKQARSRQLDLEELRTQAGRIFDGAAPELVDAIALKLHGAKPAESVAALRDLHRYAGQQRQQYTAAAETRQIAEQTQLAAALEAKRHREEQAKAEARRAAQERARIRDTGRDLSGKVAEWSAVPDEELGTLAAATEADGLDPDEIAGAQAEIERRSREEAQARPLSRDEQIRLIERYGGINPAHPVHKGELATIRESELGRNRQLWREDGTTLDRLAEQVRQDLQNGPQNEADVLEWLAELAAGRAPKFYERGEAERAAYARSLPPATRFSVQRAQPHPLAPDRTIPGYEQVDFYENGQNTRSATPDQLRAEDYEVPAIPEAMPTGQYSEDQVAGRARWAVAEAPVADKIGTPKFAAWFGQSKVIDPEGNPLPLYHGTQTQEWTWDDATGRRKPGPAFTAFDKNRIGSRTDEGYLGRGFYFTDRPDIAQWYAAMTADDHRNAKQRGPWLESKFGSRLGKFFLALQNPLIIDGPANTTGAFDKRRVLQERIGLERDALADVDYLTFKIKDAGYDGVIYRFPDGGMEVVAFEPTQIKSATANRGTFDPNNPDIRFANARSAQATDALPPQTRRHLDKLTRRYRRVLPAVFRDIEVKIADVQQALRAEGENPPDGVEAAYLPRLHAERDLIALATDVALRNDGRTGLARLLHESAHAYWRMLSPETCAALRRLYDRDLREQWSPLWRDGELITEVSQEDILSGDELGLEEWFSELMAATNAEWANRRFDSRVPGWVQDLATALRQLLQRVWQGVADQRRLAGEARAAFLDGDFRAFVTRGHSAERTAAAGAAFARHAQNQGSAAMAATYHQADGSYFFPNMVRGVGEKPNDHGVAGKGPYWSYSDRAATQYAGKNGRVVRRDVRLRNPLIATYGELNALQERTVGKMVTGFEAEPAERFDAYLRAQGYDGAVLFDPEISKTVPEEVVEFRTDGVRYAQPQKIVAAKQVDATPTSEDIARADKLIDIMPAFQGGKYQMAHPAAALIRQHWTEADREKITAVTDYFGGGGWWGSYLALTYLPKVQRITINEFDTLRAAKIRLLHEAPERLSEMIEAGANQELLQAIVAAANADEATSGTALAKRLRDLRAQFRQADPGLTGLLVDATMSARGRAVDEHGNKTAEASLERVLSIARRDAADAAKGRDALRARGIKIEVVQGYAYARPIEQGEHVLGVFDPPYYLTTGYNGKRVPLGIYEQTAATIRELAANGNAILYTDSGWWLDAADKAQTTPDIFSGDMADRAALSRIVDSLNAVAIVPVEKRHEIIGINRPGDTHDARPARRAAGATAGARRDGSAGSEERDRQGSSADRAERPGELASGAAPAPRGVPTVGPDARERFEAADAKVRALEAKLAALAEGDSQADDIEAQGRALQKELAAARRERNKTYAAATTARAFETDPVSQALAKDPTVRALRDEKIKLGGELDAAKKDGRPTEALLDRRDAIDNDLEAIRRKAEQGTFPLSYDQPVSFGDANPPRNTEPPPVAAGAPDPDHLRPIIIDDFAPYTGPQLAERLERLRRLRDAIGGDDLEAGARLSFLANLVRATREEMEARRAALELQAERDATGEAKPAPEVQAAHEDEELAREQERTAQTDLDAEAAAAIPDATEESYPVRDNVEEAGAQVSATTLAPKSRLADWFEKLGKLLQGFRSAIPELPTFKGAERFATFREGLRLLQGLDEVVRHDAEEAVADIVAPLQKLSTRAARDTQARLQELRRQIAAVDAGSGKQARMAEVKKLEAELAGDPWWIFQNVVLYGDLFTRSRLYRRDDGSPISLPGELNPAEAEHLFKLWLTRAHAHPQKAAILEARDRHKAFVGRIAADLQARGFAFAEGANTNYFPHIMLERWDGNLARVKAGTAADFRAYLISPVGSTKPIETDYLKAMYYHAVQVMAHNRRADILRDYVAREDIKPQLIEEARQARRRDPDAPPLTWRHIFKNYEADYDIYAPDPDEIPLHPELVIDRDELAKKIGVVLGNGPLQEELKKHGLTNIPLSPAEIQEMLVAGSLELWVLPKPVAEALRGVSRRAKKTDNLVTKLLAGTQGLWKRNILFAPWNWVRFDFNNLVADLEKVLVADPAMARGLIDAGRDVYRFVTGDEQASDDVRLAFRLGVLDTLTAAEVNALRGQRPFEAWETTGQARTRATVNRLTSYFTSSRWNTMEWSKLREATLRFAKFKADLERMRHGATPQYGGAYWRNVEALARVGAPEEIAELDRLGRAIGRQGPGTGPVMSATPYVLQWTQSGQRREEAFASKEGRAKRRAEIEAQQQQADAELTARKAAAISRATFGDYGELTPNGNGLRRLLIPFWSWTEVNFRYHANLFRNMHDMLRRGEIGRRQAAGQLAKQAATLGARAGMGMVLRLALPYLAVTLWNASMFGDDEDDLSEEDRRRFHLLLGRDDDGKIRVLYLPTAFSDVLKWFSGNRAAALVGDVAAGRTDWGTAAESFGDGLWRDALNNTLGSAGPIVKVAYTAASGKNTFPDVTDQRTIPSYDLRRVILGQMTDQTTAEMLELALNRDYVASRDVGDWLQQAVLQVRRRDPESWAFYAIKEKASAYEERMTGRREGRSAYDAPDAQVLRQFRRAIYQADVPTATRMYQRLLEFGYTAERFESSVRAQDPLYGLPKGLRQSFVAELNTYERAQLQQAYRYYLRMQEMEGAGRRLFPSKEASERTRARYQAQPRLDLLHREIQKALATQNNEALANLEATRQMREATR